ncbi:hypothetical protein T4D_7694 [Trichinella pseudospiralis]|uniref:Uncharacterized protein n=1 Tax=Trichinella pseudospiralis TaxID=6337 RepID=A0A0V1FAV0_TRIPS|nr:hypothetical protein T4D_7694 [Trichinella pseudospiralis]
MDREIDVDIRRTVTEEHLKWTCGQSRRWSVVFGDCLIQLGCHSTTNCPDNDEKYFQGYSDFEKLIFRTQFFSVALTVGSFTTTTLTVHRHRDGQIEHFPEVMFILPVVIAVELPSGKCFLFFERRNLYPDKRSTPPPSVGARRYTLNCCAVIW